jgi:methionyl-tRNA formyltransferase
MSDYDASSVARPSIFFFGNRGHGSTALLTCIERGENVVGICTRRPPARFGPAALRRFAGKAARRLGISKSDDFEYEDPFADVIAPHRLAGRHKIPVFWSKELHSPRLLSYLESRPPDLILCCSFHRLIPEPILATARWRSINLHPGILPDRAGGTPNRWAVRLGDRETAVTAHVMTGAFDDGEIVAEYRIPIRDDDTWGEVERRLEPVIALTVGEILDGLHGRRTLLARSPPGRQMMPPYKGAHARVDWSCPAVDVRRACNALRPKSGGIARIGGSLVCLWTVEIGPPVDALPGTVVAIDRSGRPIVATGLGTVTVTEVLSRGQVLDGSTWVSRGLLRLGDRFDQA